MYQTPLAHHTPMAPKSHNLPNSTGPVTQFTELYWLSHTHYQTLLSHTIHQSPMDPQSHNLPNSKGQVTQSTKLCCFTIHQTPMAQSHNLPNSTDSDTIYQTPLVQSHNLPNSAQSHAVTQSLIYQTPLAKSHTPSNSLAQSRYKALYWLSTKLPLSYSSG